jgi:hypothetical protein
MYLRQFANLYNRHSAEHTRASGVVRGEGGMSEAS